jgi:hypothetical protein
MVFLWFYRRNDGLERPFKPVTDLGKSKVTPAPRPHGTFDLDMIRQELDGPATPIDRIPD